MESVYVLCMTDYEYTEIFGIYTDKKKLKEAYDKIVQNDYRCMGHEELPFCDLPVIYQFALNEFNAWINDWDKEYRRYYDRCEDNKVAIDEICADISYPMSTKKEFWNRFNELSPGIYYGDIDDNVQLSVLSKRPDGKVYACCESMSGTGDLELIVCITDRRIECCYTDSLEDVQEWSEKMLDIVLRLGERLDWFAKYETAKTNGNWPMKMELDEKLTSGFIEAYTPSIDTAAYLRSIDHQFSIPEKAAMIRNHQCLSEKEKSEALQRMKELYQLDSFSDFYPIPHDFRNGDIVHLVGNEYRSVLGVILGYDEKSYEHYCNMSGDYSDIQLTVDTRFLIEGYDDSYHPVYDYLGEFSHKHVNPIYIERARLGHDNECRWYLEYLAACGTEREGRKHMPAQEVIAKQMRTVWQHYPELSLMELMITAAKAAKLWIKHPQMEVKDLVCLPEADKIDVANVKDFELMDGLFYMLPKKVKEEIWSREQGCAEEEGCGIL